MIKKVILPVLLMVSVGSSYAAKKPAPTSEMDKVLTTLASKGGKAIEKLTAVEARKQPTPTDAVKTIMANEKISAPSAVTVSDIQVDGAAGKIPARLYVPQGVTTPMPVVVYFHGGGFVIADNNVYDATPRSLADQTKAIFVSVEYRKAPEHKFPAAHDDAYEAYKWVLKNAASFNGDPKRVAVAGESAGGNLALNVAIEARDAKIQIPVHELLVYPVAGNNMNTASYKQNADAKPLNKEMMGWFISNYLSEPGQKNDKRINLLTANFNGLSPATVITAQIDPLRSEGMELAEKMRAAGVDVKYKNYNGVTHEFFGMAAVVKEAKEAQEFAAKDLKKSFKQ